MMIATETNHSMTKEKICGRKEAIMDLVTRDNVQILDEAADWKDAIRQSTQLLEQHGYVESRYKEEIIKNVEEMGPYIVLAPYIALPHARPEQGVIKTQIGVTLFRQEVSFDAKEDPAKLFITLAAQDNNSHLEALVTISELLQQDEVVEKILNAESEDMLYQYFQ